MPTQNVCVRFFLSLSVGSLTTRWICPLYIRCLSICNDTCFSLAAIKFSKRPSFCAPTKTESHQPAVFYIWVISFVCWFSRCFSNSILFRLYWEREREWKKTDWCCFFLPSARSLFELEGLNIESMISFMYCFEWFGSARRLRLWLLVDKSNCKHFDGKIQLQKCHWKLYVGKKVSELLPAHREHWPRMDKPINNEWVKYP